MSNQLRLLTSPVTDRRAGEPAIQAAEHAPRRRRNAGPADSAGRISVRTRRAGRRGVEAAREALEAATSTDDLRRAG